MFCCAMAAAHPGRHAPDCETQSSESCPNHKIIAHDMEGKDRWCDFCGRDAEGNQIKRAAGGWGTPSRIRR